MPTKTSGWLANNGLIYTDVAQAQVADLVALLNETDGSAAIDGKWLETLASDIVCNQAEKVVAILTTGPKSRPGARKRPGTTAPRRALRGSKDERAVALKGRTTTVNGTNDGDVQVYPAPGPDATLPAP